MNVELNDMSGSIKTTKQPTVSNPLEHVVSSELEGVAFHAGEVLHYKGVPFRVAAPIVLLGLNSNKQLAKKTNE